MSKTDSLESSVKINSGSSSESKPKNGTAVPVGEDERLEPAEIDDSGASSAIDGIDLENPAIGDITGDPPKKRGPGAPKNNINALKHGLNSRNLIKAKRGPLRGKSKRLVRATAEAVLADQGDLDTLSHTFQFVIQRFAKRVGRLAQMDAALEKFIARNPMVKEQPLALQKFYAFVRDMENDAIGDAKLIGFVRVGSKNELAPWETEDKKK